MRTITFFLMLPLAVYAADSLEDQTKALRDVADQQLAKDPGKTGKFADDFSRTIRTRLTAANKADRDTWSKIQSKEDWEKFRAARLAALRNAVGTFSEPPKNLNVRVTKTIEGDGYRIDNCLYESRPGLWVTGNLYRPTKPGDSMPGFIICHSHHNPKHEGELQDMGVLWAKLGCYVLVIDQLGHGERRQHPFHDAKSYPDSFRVGRQDYFFRYNLGMQLSLVGESLIGWMAWDVMRGVDLLLKQPGIAKDKLILLGAVAGGGDPAAVAAALDPRINCVCPFNFGGPQPETKYPLPDNAEEWFNYAGSGSWESTRNIRDSVKGGVLPWAIVASVAPRKVIHAHEFSWDQERDPVWKRYQKVYDWYGAKDNLAFAYGRGMIVGNDPNASHCNNIGVVHRQLIYAALKKWYGIPLPEREGRERRSAEELRCWTAEALKELQPKPLTAILDQRAEQLLTEARREQSEAKILERTQQALGARWVLLPTETPVLLASPPNRSGGVVFDSLGLTFEDHVTEVLYLRPHTNKNDVRFPVVVGVCQEGRWRFLRERAEAIARLLQQGCAVVLVDVRGIGTQRPGDGRGRSSGATSISSSTQMLGETLLGQRARDLAIVLRELGRLPGIDGKRIGLWGESFALPNGTANVTVPHDAAKQPALAEPLGTTLVSLVALQQLNVQAVLARGGLVSYRSVLDSPFVYVPHDALPVRIFTAGDLPDIWSVLKQRSIRLEGMVNGQNQRLPQPALDRLFKDPIEASTDYSNEQAIADWLTKQLKK